METIGNRAYKEIEKRAIQNGIKPSNEAEKILINSNVLSKWKLYGDPSAYYLQQMCLAGYDVIYILTGERSSNG